MLTINDFDRLVAKGTLVAADECAEDSDEIRAIPLIAYAIRTRVRETAFRGQKAVTNIADLFEVCGVLDALESEVPAGLRATVVDLRDNAFSDLFKLFYTRKFDDRGIVPDLDPEAYGRVRTERDIAVIVATHFLPMIRKENPERITMAFLEERCPDAVRDLRHILGKLGGGTPDWTIVKKLLPRSLRDRFVVDEDARDDGMIRELIRAHWHVAETLGVEVLMDFLASQGIVGLSKSRIRRIVGQYLRKCTRIKPKPRDIVSLPPGILMLASARETLEADLRIIAYRKLLALRVDERNPGSYPLLLGELRSFLNTYEPSGGDGANRAVFAEISDAVFCLMEKALLMPVPERMTVTITVRGKTKFFPSLRQRIAAVLFEKEGKKGLIAFPMGEGKTETMFLIKEHVGVKKMLIVCTPEMARKIPARIRRDMRRGEKERVPVYREGMEPSVGVISSGITEKELAVAMEKEIVLVSYSMLWQIPSGGTKPIVESIIDQSRDDNRFDILGIDESQLAKKTEEKKRKKRRVEEKPERDARGSRKRPGTYAKAVKRLAYELPDLYEKGRIVLSSATPFTNGVEDVVSTLQIIDRELYKNAKSLRHAIRKTDPIRVRVALLNGIINLDATPDWEQYTTTETYPLGEEQRRMYARILDTEDVHPNTKLMTLLLCCQNPSVLTGDAGTPSGFLPALTAALRDDRSRYSAVFLAQDKRRGGMSRPDLTYDPQGRQTFVKRLASAFPDATIHIIDGDTPMKEREPIIEDAQAAELERDACEECRRYRAKMAAYDAAKRSGAERAEKSAENACRKNHRFVLVYVQGGTTTLIGQSFSFAHRLHVMNGIPWNISDISQPIFRFAREGNADVTVSVWEPEGTTIYTGVGAHAREKEYFIDRVLHGGAPVTEDIAELGPDDLIDAVTGKKFTGFRYGGSVIRHLMSDRQILSIQFQQFRDASVGEREYEDFLVENGEYQASLYTRDYERTFSANNAKFTAGIIEKLESDGIIRDTRFLDVAAGPCALALALGFVDRNFTRKRTIDSVDLNPHMLRRGKRMLRDQGVEGEIRCETASMTDMRLCVPDSEYDVLHCGLALDFPGRDILPEEEKNGNGHPTILDAGILRTLLEFNRALAKDGTLILTLNAETMSQEEFDRYRDLILPTCGFTAIERYTGAGVALDHGSKDKFRNLMIVAEKTGEFDEAAAKEFTTEDIAMTWQTKRAAHATTVKVIRLDDETPETCCGVIHEQFRLNNEAFTFAADPEERMERFRRIRSRVLELRRILAEHSAVSFHELPEDILERLSSEGVTPILIGQSLGKRATEPVLIADGDFVGAIHPDDTMWN